MQGWASVFSGRFACTLLLPHILYNRGTAGINAIPAAAPGDRERRNKAGLGSVKGGRERNEDRKSVV